MKLPLSWLGEFVTLQSELPELCRRLTMAGLEVENCEQVGAGFSDVFVAKVLTVERHPNADRLHLCEVDAGRAGHARVVCGAPNVHAGMLGAFAGVGARLVGSAHGPGGGKLEEAAPLKAAVIRGVASEGMLCSEMELGLSSDHRGIVELEADAEPGEPLHSYLQLPDTVLDLAITPNRGDCLSILGVAREVAALLQVRLKPPRFKPLRIPATPTVRLTVEVLAPELCPRYAALAMNRIALGAAPLWMRRRLELCGMRPVNNVVDVTNYVMLELGQPLHAFDLAQVAGARIVVRRAGDEREFETLDGVTRALEANDLMIADRDKPLAIAGVMGGHNSEVAPQTSSIILESAYFEPAAIARTARRLALRSEASYRFERGIDRAGQINALLRAADLMRRVAGGTEASALLDAESRPMAERRIELRFDSIDSLLGVRIAPREVRRRLTALGATVTAGGRKRLIVTPPPFRPDLNETADLAEEVARLEGLAEIPAALPTRPALAAAVNFERAFAKRMRGALIGCGLVEAKTIAFIAPADNERFPVFIAAEQGRLLQAAPVAVHNPLSAELSELRLSLLPGLLAALRFNLNREANALHLFEIGKVFMMRDEMPTEARRVAGISYGDYAMGSVDHPAVQASFLTVKGILEQTFNAIGMRPGIVFKAVEPSLAPYVHPRRAAQITLGGSVIGLLGEIHPEQALRLELSYPCVLFELDLGNLMFYSTETRQAVQPPPKFPAVRRDVALVLDRDFPANAVVRTVIEVDSPWLESVDLFDVYEGGSVPIGKKSIALACRYRAKDRTLTDEEVNRAHHEVVEQAKARLGAELRL